MPATSSTSALNFPGASGSLPITSAAVVAGTASLPVYVGPVNGAQLGVYVTASPDFVGGFGLRRRGSGFKTGEVGAPQSVVNGDDKFMAFAGPAPVATISGMDTVFLNITNYTGGSLTMSVVQ